MARIAGVDLPREKRIEIGLTYVYGIGRSTADQILAGTGINPDIRVKDLSAEDEAKIREYIDKNDIIVEGDLRRNVALDIKRLTEIQCYRGVRHRKGLPCRGHEFPLKFHQCGFHNLDRGLPPTDPAEIRGSFRTGECQTRLRCRGTLHDRRSVDHLRDSAGKRL